MKLLILKSPKTIYWLAAIAFLFAVLGGRFDHLNISVAFVALALLMLRLAGLAL